VISESQYWKDLLLRMAARIRALKAGRTLTNRRAVQLEKDLLIGFYSARKLIDAPAKLSDSTKDALFTVASHPNTHAVNWLNNHRINELYDFAITYEESHRIRFIANSIIHSFILAPALDTDGHLASILFTSDFDKDKKLYELKVENVVTIFALLGRDYPHTIHWQRDPHTSDETLEVD
jgi:hypothetical protein